MPAALGRNSTRVLLTTSLWLASLLVLGAACGSESTSLPVDGSVDQLGPDPDRGVDDATTPDVVPMPDGPLGQKCRQAVPIPLQEGYGKGFGQIVASDDRSDVNLDPADCANSATPGAERMHTVELQAGKKYFVQVVPDFGMGGPSTILAPSVYVFSSCADIAGSCLGGDAMLDTRPDKFPMVQVLVAPEADGVYYIGVDSAIPPGTEGSYGSYEVTVFETPANDTCEAARPLAWSGTRATATSVLSAASNTVDMGSASAGCDVGPTPGADLFFAVDLQSGKSYRVSAPEAGAALYVFSDCADIAGSCIGGAPWSDGFIVSPPKGGTYLVAVDLPYPVPPDAPPLPFTLTVEEVTPPANDTCETAEKLSWSGGTATATADPALATDTLDLGPGGCTQMPTPGPDVFFEVALTAGKSYRVSVDPPVPASLYLLSGCVNPAQSCIAGNEFGMPVLSLSVQDSGDYIIVLDTDPGVGVGPGALTLTVEEFVPPANDTCQGATTLTWSQDVASTTVTFDGSESNAFDMGPQGCVESTPGPDLFYQVALAADTAYAVTLTIDPMTGKPPMVYVLDSCSADPSSCIAGSGFFGIENVQVSFIAPASGDYVIGVDYPYPMMPGEPQPGPMTLQVVSFTPADNSTCASPQPLSFSGADLTVQGDTTLSFNDMADIKCADMVPFDGPQLYYSVPLQAQKSYLLLLDSDPTSYRDTVVYAFPATTACNATAINPACYYTYSEPTPGPRHVVVTPQTAEDWIVAVDSRDGQGGPFTLHLQELTAPANDTCASAKLLAFGAGESSLSLVGRTLAASSAVALPATGCTGRTTGGPDVFYQLPVKAGSTYDVMLTPGDMQADAALYVFGDCADVAGSCTAGADQPYPGSPEMLTFDAVANGAVYIGVDAYGPADETVFALQVIERGPPPANDTCADAEALVFDASGVATASGDTRSATDTLGMLDCAPEFPLFGGDAFYEVQLTAGTTYTITATPSGSYDLLVFLLSSCDPVTGCLQAADKAIAGQPEVMTFTPSASASYIIGVDSTQPPPPPGYPSSAGGFFTLEVK